MTWTAINAGDRAKAYMVNEIMDAIDERQYSTAGDTGWHTHASAGSRITGLGTLQTETNGLYDTGKWVAISWTSSTNYTITAKSHSTWTYPSLGARLSKALLEELQKALGALITYTMTVTEAKLGRFRDRPYYPTGHADCAEEVAFVDGSDLANWEPATDGYGEQWAELDYVFGVGYHGWMSQNSYCSLFTCRATVAGKEGLSDARITASFFKQAFTFASRLDEWPNPTTYYDLTRDVVGRVRMGMGSMPETFADATVFGAVIETATFESGTSYHPEAFEYHLQRSETEIEPGEHGVFVICPDYSDQMAGAELCGVVWIPPEYTPWAAELFRFQALAVYATFGFDYV